MSRTFDATRVVIVDDDPLMREGLKQILRGDLSIDVTGEAANGREALNLVARTRPDIVIMDLSMPKLDGVATTRQILDLVPESKIVAISVYTDMDRAWDVIDAGAMAYLVKAGAPRYLISAVQAVATGGVFFSPGISAQLMGKLNQPRMAGSHG